VGRWKDKYVIGLTGNIATGKSLVRRMLEHLGAYTLDADGLAHQVMTPSAPAYKPILEVFGKFVLKPDGQIDRDRLGAMAFSHPDALRALESITHPVIISAIDTLISRARHQVVVVEAIKLLEGDLAGFVDAVWVVDSTPATQLQRLMTKRGLSELDAKKRISIQNPQADKVARADVVINNEGNPDQTWAQVQQAWATARGGEEDTAAIQAVQTVHVQPTPPQQAAAAAAAPAGISSIDITRPRPTEFDKLAALINRETGSNVTRDDIMANFGEKTYMMAEANGNAVGIIAFLVENLVTRVDEFVIDSRVPLKTVGPILIEAMENASNDLQSEVAFVFLKSAAAATQRQVFVDQGYAEQKPEDIRYPAWREAISEFADENTVLLSKRLRENLILKPI
jgi:dephospho-CoA kinase